MGVCSMLLCDKSSKLQTEVRDSLDLIMASSSLLLVLINNLLDVRKCDSNSKFYDNDFLLCVKIIMDILCTFLRRQ